MKIGVITLKTRPERLQSFSWAMRGFDFEVMPSVTPMEAIDEGWRADSRWRDGFTGKKTTNEELSCFVNHFQSWGICQRINEPMIILEDDAIPIVNPRIELYEKAIRNVDFLYLGYKENIPSGVKRIDDDLIAPRYPHWMSSYVITPKAAVTFINAVAPKNLIPVDEWVPIMLGYDHSDSPWRTRAHAERVSVMERFEKIKSAALAVPDFVQSGAIIRPGISYASDIGVSMPWQSSIETTQNLYVCPTSP